MQVQSCSYLRRSRHLFHHIRKYAFWCLVTNANNNERRYLALNH